MSKSKHVRSPKVISFAYDAELYKKPTLITLGHQGRFVTSDRKQTTKEILII